jgi:anhydro-N-acetylmuramic acid kinase
MRVIGLMSGTSFDAIDAAAADLTLDDDVITLTPLGVLSRPYPAHLRDAIGAALPPGPTTVEQVCRLDTLIGQAFAALAGEADEQLCGGAADLVVSHGQTVFHWVDAGRVKGTLQLGQPAWIAEHTGLTVVADLRARDIAAGGQGAPLVSLFDLLWLGSRPGTPVALNLGGIANITVASRERDPVAFDTGPANALIDAAVARSTDGRSRYDAEGATAARGQVDTRLLDRLLDEPYYAAAAPKSTGKELFSLPYLLNALDDGEPRRHEDVVATLTALTARTVADAVARSAGTEVIAAGGGTSNPVLMSMLATALGGTPLTTTAELGVPPTAKEAYAFATLGFLSVHGLAGTVASCTGARRPTVLGSVTPGLRALPLSPGPPGGVTRLHVEARP